MARQDEKNRARGLSGSVVAGATVLPIAIGAGISAHSIYRSRNELVEIFSRTNLDRNSRVQDIVNNLVNTSSVPSFSDIGRKIASLSTSTKFGGESRALTVEDVRLAWKQASRSITDPAIASKIDSSLKNAASAREMLDILSIELKGGSTYTNRAASIFMSNIHAMRNSLKTGPIDVGPIQFNKFKAIKSVKNMDKVFGSGAKASIREYVGNLGSRTQFVRITGGMIGDNSLRLRIANEIGGGIVASGVGGQTLNAVGAFAVWDGNKITGMLNYDEWVRRQMSTQLPNMISALGSNPTQAQINQVASDFGQRIRQPFEYIAQPFVGAGYTDETRIAAGLAKHTVTVVDPSGNILEGNALANFYKQAASVRLPVTGANKLFPLSPNRVGGAKFTTMDPALFGAFPELAQYSRRPGQMYRSFFPTNESMSRIMSDSLTRRHTTTVGQAFAMADDSEFRHLLKTPGTRTLYTTQPFLPALSEGQFAVSNRVRDMFNVTSLEDITIDSEQVAKSVLGLKPGQALDPDMLLGFDTDGSAIRAGHGATFVGSATFPRDEAGEKGLMKMAIRRTYNAEDFQKFFGIKGTGHFMDERIMRGYDVIAHVDELRKNRSMLNKQVFTALTEFNYENMSNLTKSLGDITEQMRHAQAMGHHAVVDQLRNISGPIAERLEYLKTYDPEELMPQLKGMLAGGAVDSTAAIKEMASWARAMHMSPEQAGLIFGAVPAATGLSREQMMSQLGFQESWMQHIMKGEAMGVSHLYSAGPKALTGAGTAMASVEPRIFELLQEGQFGPLSGIIRQDLLSRRMALDPENMLARGELAQTMRGVAGMGIDVPTGARMFDITDPKLTHHMLNPLDPNFIGANGPAYVNMGGVGGMKNLYVPGRGSFNEFTPFAMHGEQAVASPLMRGYQNFLNAARAAANDPTQAGALQAAKASFTEVLHEAHAGTMYGKGGIQRGKILGSRFLTGVSTKEAGEDIFRVGIGESSFFSMIEEMKSVAERTIADRTARSNHLAQLEIMTKTFMQGGEVGGYMLRHPLFEQFSLVPVRMRLNKNLRDDVVDIPFLTKKATIQGMQGTTDLNWSLVKGMGGDFDADIYGMILGDPTKQSDIMAGARSGSSVGRAFEDYAIRQQLIKTRSAKDVGLNAMEALQGDIHKMALSNEIGMLSFEMSKARLALIQHGGGGRDVSDALSLLAWTEQNIISGKHATAAQAAGLPGQIQDLITNIRNPSPGMGTFQNIVNQTMDDTGRAILNQDLVMDIAGEGRRVIPKVNMGNAMEVLGSSLRKFDDHFGSELSELSRWMISSGRKSIKPSEIASYLSMSSLEGAATKGTGKAVATAGLEIANKLATVGRKSVARYGKPLAIGFGASLALAAVLSNPVSNLDPVDPAIVDAKFNNQMGRQMNGMNLQSPQLGQPTGPRMATAPAPMAQHGNNMSAMISVRGKSAGRFDPSTTSDAFRQKLGPGTRINTRVQDDRRSMNAQKISEILSR